ncbi:MAG: N-6 DNA methylase, partial [Candidatus Hodarchaeales archaeon]
MTGRLYHSTLGFVLAKRYATYYTSISASELLANLCIRSYKDKIADFACGSGTLLVAAYKSKLAMAYLQGFSGKISELHKLFLEQDIWGFDAMVFAAHLATINLCLQQPKIIFKEENIYYLPIKKMKAVRHLGSLDLLFSNQINVQKRLTDFFKDLRGKKPEHGGSKVSARKVKVTNIIIPRDFDVILMNPPFSRKDRASKLLGKKGMSKITKELKKVNTEFTMQAGQALPFVVLADKYLKEEGRIGLILPCSFASSRAWKPVREYLLSRYHIQHLIVSWAPGKPAFSESTNLREIIVILEKKSNDEERRQTFCTNLDIFADPLQMREISIFIDIIKEKIQFKQEFENKTLPIVIDRETVGSISPYPYSLLELTTDTWYKLLAFRSQFLINLNLALEGKLELSGFPKIPMKSLEDMTYEVGLFVKNISTTGFKVLNDRPIGSKLGFNLGEVFPAVMKTKSDKKGIEYREKMYVNINEAVWLFRDPILFEKASEKNFTPGTGNLLILNRIDFSKLRIVAISTEEDFVGGVWYPVRTKNLVLNKKSKYPNNLVSKIIACWLQSTWGLIIYIGNRTETRGTWSVFRTEQMRDLPILDITKLPKEALDKILELWDEIKDYKWEILQKQFQNAILDKNHPRR